MAFSLNVAIAVAPMNEFGPDSIRKEIYDKSSNGLRTLWF